MGDILGIGLLIILGALFATSEISIAAARKIKLQIMADEGQVKAEQVLQLQEKPGAFFAMIQISLNGIAILGGIFGEQALTPFFERIISLVYTGGLVSQISFLLSFITITSLFILFADLLPKRLAMILPETIACKVITVMRWTTVALTPLVMFFNGITNLVLRMFNVPTEREDRVTTEDIVAMMDAGAAYGSLQQQEYQLIGNVLELEGRTLSSVMTPREQIIYFDINDTSEAISAQIIEHPHNHFLVCEGNLDKLIGSVQSKEILRQVLKGEKASISTDIIEKELFYLPETLTISEALNAFKISTEPFAVVVNEYALVVGIVNVKDLMSGFMGNLIHFSGEEQIVQRDANSWLVDGLTPIVDLAKVIEIEEFPNRSQYETVAGFLIYMIKRLPKRTDFILYAGYKFEVVDLEGVRVEQLLITRIAEQA